jgi:hypothetical protein
VLPENRCVCVVKHGLGQSPFNPRSRFTYEASEIVTRRRVLGTPGRWPYKKRMNPRVVLPEHLDTLPHTDPAAIRSRQELHLINRIMGNHRWLAKQLQKLGITSENVLELGAGDSNLLRECQTWCRLDPRQWTAMDLAPKPADWPESARWFQGDIFSLNRFPSAEVVLTNLFLHHWEEPNLRWIGSNLPPECRVFVANEPCRRSLHQLQGRLLSSLARLSWVTRHDMERSINAGFLGNELPHLLGLSGWNVHVEYTFLGAYRMRAWR